MSKKNYRFQNREVAYSEDIIPTLRNSNVDDLKKLSLLNDRKRIRLCTHNNLEAKLHEMFIIHHQDTYVRPHKHIGKSESTHIIEGLVDIIIFDDDGRIEQVINMGDYSSGKIFYFRMEKPYFHTLIIRSEVLVFHEITNGPFDLNTTIFAHWSPDGVNEHEVINFIKNINSDPRVDK